MPPKLKLTNYWEEWIMANELQIFSADILSPEDVSDLDKHIEATINAHKNNRQAINRLVSESVAAITEGERCKEQLSNKGWFGIFVGSITGSNRRLQNKINSKKYKKRCFTYQDFILYTIIR